MTETNTNIDWTPKKLVINPNAISSKTFHELYSIIKWDEGGWVLTSDPHDDDGGYTYGGMTAKVLQEYFPWVTQEKIREIVIPREVNETMIMLQDWIISIYWQNYVAPLTPLMSSHPEVTVPSQAYISCSINCGAETAAGLIKKSFGAPQGQQEKEFLRLWMLHYIEVCKNNPDKLRYLDGWINRVFKYVKL